MPNANNGPLSVLASDRAKADAKHITDWLRGLPFSGDELAERFGETLPRELINLCADLDERFATGSNLPRPDEEASIAFARPAYRHTFTTGAGGKRKKRQTAGVYVVFYDLTTTPGKVNVITIRHSASEPLTADFDRPFAADDATE